MRQFIFLLGSCSVLVHLRNFCTCECCSTIDFLLVAGACLGQISLILFLCLFLPVLYQGSWAFHFLVSSWSGFGPVYFLAVPGRFVH